MGQTHTKPVPVEPSPSSGPDPTIFRIRPSLPPPAHSSEAMQPSNTSDTHTRIDYNPAGGLPVPTVASRSKSMVRKLSKKAFRRVDSGSRVEGFMAKHMSPTLDEDLKAFEDLVLDAEARTSPVQVNGLPPSRMTKAGTFKRMSISAGSRIHFPRSAPPSHIRPATHRRSSTSSVHSGRLSMGSAHRAEREWRAQVAGLAHAPGTPRSSIAEVRGLPPPRRTPAPFRSPSPEDDTITTPPQTDIDHGAPIIRNRSFETLGYHALDSSLRARKASVPYSVSSSYCDPNSRGGTRPSSLATGQLLPAVPPSPTDHRASLPPFDSFRISPGSITDSPIMTPTRTNGMQPMLNNPQLSPVLAVKIGAESVERGQQSRPKRPYPEVHNSPLSLTSAFYLTAPIEQIAWTDDHPDPPTRSTSHPYALAIGSRHSPIRPTPPSKSPLQPMYTVPVHAEDDDRISFDPFTVPRPVPRRVLGPRIQSNTGIPAALRPRGPSPRIEVLGTGCGHGIKRDRLDLTPGMETGHRPPKSGLPAADVQRWLQAMN